MDFHLSMIYRDIMPLVPKKLRRKTASISDKYSYGWVYLANKDTLAWPVVCRSLSSLSRLANENTYITPSAFWHSKDRNKLTLRWLNAYVLDYDDLLDPEEVLSRITAAGLSAPSFLNQTDSGIHAWWLFDRPVRVSSQKVVTLYDSIHRVMVRAAKSDPHFTAASERFVRVPKNVVWSSMNRYTFDSFKEWREIFTDTERSQEKISNVILLNSGTWLSSPAIKALFSMNVNIGQRNSACYTLSLAFKADHKEQDEAETALLGWNDSLSDPLPYREVLATVASAYRGRGSRPSRRYLSLLVGSKLAYAKVRYITPPKPRSERSKWHLTEISELIVQDLFEKQFIEESQVEWAKRLGIPVRSFKLVLAELRESGIVFGVTGRGRYAVSYYKLSETFLSHGTEAFYEDCEEVNNLTEKTEESPSVLSACADLEDWAVDNSDFNFNGAYPLIQVVSGVVGGSLPSLPRSLPDYLIRCLRSLKRSGIGSRVPDLLDTG